MDFNSEEQPKPKQEDEQQEQQVIPEQAENERQLSPREQIKEVFLNDPHVIALAESVARGEIYTKEDAEDNEIPLASVDVLRGRFPTVHEIREETAKIIPQIEGTEKQREYNQAEADLLQVLERLYVTEGPTASDENKEKIQKNVVPRIRESLQGKIDNAALAAAEQMVIAAGKQEYREESDVAPIAEVLTTYEAILDGWDQGQGGDEAKQIYEETYPEQAQTAKTALKILEAKQSDLAEIAKTRRELAFNKKAVDSDPGPLYRARQEAKKTQELDPVVVEAEKKAAKIAESHREYGETENFSYGIENDPSELHPGHTEDRVKLFEAQGVLVLSDGIGGAEGGEQAAQNSIDGVGEFLGEHSASEFENGQDFVRKAIENASKKLIDENAKLGFKADSPDRPGATISVVAVNKEEGKVAYGWLGDSPLYKFTKKTQTLERLSVDDIGVESDPRVGKLTQEEKAQFQNALANSKNPLAELQGNPKLEAAYRVKSHIGQDVGNFTELHTGETTFEDGDEIYALSDGFTDPVEDPRIQELAIQYQGNNAALLQALGNEARNRNELALDQNGNSQEENGKILRKHPRGKPDDKGGAVLTLKGDASEIVQKTPPEQQTEVAPQTSEPEIEATPLETQEAPSLEIAPFTPEEGAKIKEGNKLIKKFSDLAEFLENTSDRQQSFTYAAIVASLSTKQLSPKETAFVVSTHKQLMESPNGSEVTDWLKDPEARTSLEAFNQSIQEISAKMHLEASPATEQTSAKPIEISPEEAAVIEQANPQIAELIAAGERIIEDSQVNRGTLVNYAGIIQTLAFRNPPVSPQEAAHIVATYEKNMDGLDQHQRADVTGIAAGLEDRVQKLREIAKKSPSETTPKKQGFGSRLRGIFGRK